MKYLDIEKFRHNYGLTQDELSKILGVHRNTIINWEKGGVVPVSKHALISNIMQNYASTKIDNVKEIDDKENVISTKNGLDFVELQDGGYLVTVDVPPIDVKMKYLEDGIQEFGDWERVTFRVSQIGRGNYKGFRHIGNSMFNPENPGYYDVRDGDISLCRELSKAHWMDGFKKEKAPYGWVILTESGNVHKDIDNFDIKSGMIKCLSRNPSPEYSGFEISVNEVRSIHKVITVNHNSKNIN